MKKLLTLILFLPAGTLVAQDSLRTHDLKEVVVTGQYEPQSLKQSLYQVRTISAQMIQQRNATSIQNILNTELGIRFTNDNTLGTSDIFLMGMNGQNVKILLDGVPMLDRGATRESLNQIDINSIERIEIVEGPMSVMYGTDALAGVVNIITKKGSDTGTLSVEARVLEETAGDEYEAFSGDGVHNESVTIHGKHKNWYGTTGITRNNFGGWQGASTGRMKDWLPKEQWLATGMIGHKSDKLNVWYRLNYLDENILTRGAELITDTRHIATDKEYITKRYTHQAQAEWTLSDALNLNASASYQDLSRRTRTTVYDYETGRRTLSTGAGEQDLSEFNTAFLRGMFHHKLSQAVSLQYGTEINHSKGMGDRIDGSRTISDYAVFASAEIKALSIVAIRPGVRFLYNSVYDAPPVVPSVNVKVALTEQLDLRASYGRGYRAPALRELYFYFHDTNHSIDGNPDLKAEHSNSFTASVNWQVYTSATIRFNSVLAGFYNNFENMITTGAKAGSNTDYTYVNILRNKTRGGTLTNTFVWRNLKATAGFSYIGVYNVYSADDTSLPDIMWTPEVNATAQYTFNRIGTTLGAYYKFNGRQANYEVVNSAIQRARRDAYEWLDITASKTFGKYLTLGAGAKNVLGVKNIRNTSQDLGGAHSTGGPVPMSYGRSYFVSLAVRWSK